MESQVPALSKTTRMALGTYFTSLDSFLHRRMVPSSSNSLTNKILQHDLSSLVTFQGMAVCAKHAAVISHYRGVVERSPNVESCLSLASVTLDKSFTSLSQNLSSGK